MPTPSNSNARVPSLLQIQAVVPQELTIRIIAITTVGENGANNKAAVKKRVRVGSIKGRARMLCVGSGGAYQKLGNNVRRVPAAAWRR